VAFSQKFTSFPFPRTPVLVPMVTRLLEAVDAHDGVAEFNSFDGLAVWKTTEDGFGKTCSEVGFLRVIVSNFTN